MARKTQRGLDEIKQGVVDVHTHVLPGLDDGAEKMAVSYRMLQRSYKQGVRKIIATPHYTAYHWRTDPQQIEKLVEKLAAHAKRVMPELKLYSGQEIQYFDGMVDRLREGKLLTLAGSRYVLTEFLPTSPWSQIQGAVRELTMAGYLPVLAHIERYQCLRQKGRLEELIKEGAYLQMNYGSLTKLTHFWKIRERLDRRWCRKVLLDGYISFLGTDMHGNRHRVPNSAGAIAWIRKKGGEELARQLSVENPEKILRDEKL